MKTFNDFPGIEGIDKLVEASPHIYEILGDKKVIALLDDQHNWIEFGGAVVKAHEEAVAAIMDVLGEKPTNPISLVSGIAKVMFEVVSNKDMIDFFTSLPKSEKSQTSAMENTEGEQ